MTYITTIEEDLRSYRLRQAQDAEANRLRQLYNAEAYRLRQAQALIDWFLCKEDRNTPTPLDADRKLIPAPLPED
jgi:hypothetical protein